MNENMLLFFSVKLTHQFCVFWCLSKLMRYLIPVLVILYIGQNKVMMLNGWKKGEKKKIFIWAEFYLHSEKSKCVHRYLLREIILVVEQYSFCFIHLLVMFFSEADPPLTCVWWSLPNTSPRHFMTKPQRPLIIQPAKMPGAEIHTSGSNLQDNSALGWLQDAFNKFTSVKHYLENVFFTR